MNTTDEFCELLINWCSANDRKFPWRIENPRLYETLVTEILLWKTRAETVSKFYYTFFLEYPEVQSLKAASTKELKKKLKPLGLYNRRANLLKKIADNISKLERIDEETIRKTLGLGQYISRALMAFYFDVRIIPVDENIKRLLSRFFNFEVLNIRKISKKEDSFLNKLLVNGYNQKHLIWGLIDFSSIICKKVKPVCNECIFKKKCNYYRKNSLVD